MCHPPENRLTPNTATACPKKKQAIDESVPQSQNLALRNHTSAECARCKSYARVDSSIPNRISLTIVITH